MKYKWKHIDWQITAAKSIESVLGKAVEENTGQKYGYFSGVSTSDIADIIDMCCKKHENVNTHDENERKAKLHDELVNICKELADIFPEESISELDAADFKDRANRIWTVALEAKQALASAKGGV